MSPKAFDLLAGLIAYRDRAMSKAELQHMLWPSTFVEEASLAGLVVHLRRALEDPADDPKYIRTVYGFGYRFVGEVQARAESPKAGVHVSRFFIDVLERHIHLLAGTNVVGRSPEASIRIDSPGLSRRHAQITVSGGNATLEDLGSKNGTRLNGRLITGTRELVDGDRIQVGEVHAVFRTGTEEEATQTLTDGLH